MKDLDFETMCWANKELSQLAKRNPKDWLRISLPAIFLILKMSESLDSTASSFEAPTPPSIGNISVGGSIKGKRFLNKMASPPQEQEESPRGAGGSHHAAGSHDAAAAVQLYPFSI